MNHSITTSALLLGALTASTRAQTFTTPPQVPRPASHIVAPPTGTFLGGGDDCAAPDLIAGQGNFAYNTLTSTTGSQGQNESNRFDFGTTGVASDVWYTWIADATGNATMSMCPGGAGDTKIAAYPGVGCPSDGTSLACNDDACQLLSMITFPGGSRSTGFFDITIAGPPSLGTSYCLAGANSVSVFGSNMSATGSTNVSAQNLTLIANNAPSQPAIFYFGPNQLQVAFGNGYRCVGGFTVRLPVVGGSGGTLQYTIDWINHPIPTGTQNFQCWYRDPAGGGAFFNLSNGYSILMTP